MVKPPAIDEAVVEWLGKIFPDRIPSHITTIEQFHIYIGQQDVIRKLRHTLNEQQKNPLEAS